MKLAHAHPIQDAFSSRNKRGGRPASQFLLLYISRIWERARQLGPPNPSFSAAVNLNVVSCIIILIPSCMARMPFGSWAYSAACMHAPNPVKLVVCVCNQYSRSKVFPGAKQIAARIQICAMTTSFGSWTRFKAQGSLDIIVKIKYG